MWQNVPIHSPNAPEGGMQTLLAHPITSSAQHPGVRVLGVLLRDWATKEPGSCARESKAHISQWGDWSLSPPVPSPVTPTLMVSRRTQAIGSQAVGKKSHVYKKSQVYMKIKVLYFFCRNPNPEIRITMGAQEVEGI